MANNDIPAWLYDEDGEPLPGRADSATWVNLKNVDTGSEVYYGE